MPRLQPSIAVTPTNLKKTAQRVLNGQALVSPEIEYIVRTMGSKKTTQQELDAMVMNVRRMPWATIMPAE